MATKTAPVAVSVGDRVQVITHNGKLGTVRFVGETQFASGVWVGVELDVPEGKHNGVVGGVAYFACPDMCGIFVKTSAVKKDSTVPASSAAPVVAAPVAAVSVAAEPVVNLPPSVPSSSIPLPKTVAIESESSDSAVETAAEKQARYYAAQKERLAAQQAALQQQQAAQRARQQVPPSTAQPAAQPASSAAPIPEAVESQTIAAPSSSMPAPLVESRVEVRSASLSLLSPEVESKPAASQPDEEDKQVARRLDADLASPAPTAVARSRDNLQSLMDRRRTLMSKTATASTTATTASAPASASVLAPSTSDATAELLAAKMALESQIDSLRREIDEVKSSATTATAEAHRLKAELSEARAASRQSAAAAETTISELQELLERCTLDKTQAEVARDEAQTALSAAQDDLEAAQLEAQLATEERQLAVEEALQAAVPSGDAAAAECVELRAQNAKLTEALRKLRDLQVSETAKFEQRLAAARREIDAIQPLRERLDALSKLPAQLQRAKDECEELKEALDDARVHEAMVERLTEKNLVLGEQVDSLRSQVRHLEAVQSACEDIEAEHVEVETQLQRDLSTMELQLSDAQRALSAAAARANAQSQTIAQFRTLVQQQEGQLNTMKRTLSSREAETESQQARARQALDRNLTLIRRAAEWRSASVSASLSALSAAQAQSRLDMMQSYVPASLVPDSRLMTLLLSISAAYSRALLASHLLTVHYIDPTTPDASSSDAIGSMSIALESVVRQDAEMPPNSHARLTALRLRRRLHLIGRLLVSARVCLFEADAAQCASMAANHRQLMSLLQLLDALVRAVSRDELQSQSTTGTVIVSDAQMAFSARALDRALLDVRDFLQQVPAQAERGLGGGATLWAVRLPAALTQDDSVSTIEEETGEISLEQSESNEEAVALNETENTETEEAESKSQKTTLRVVVGAGACGLDMLALDVVALAHASRDELGASLRSLRSMLTEDDAQSEGLSVEQQQEQQETDAESEQQRVRAYLGAVRVDTLTRIEREFAFFAQQLRALGSQVHRAHGKVVAAEARLLGKPTDHADEDDATVVNYAAFGSQMLSLRRLVRMCCARAGDMSRSLRRVAQTNSSEDTPAASLFAFSSLTDLEQAVENVFHDETVATAQADSAATQSRALWQLLRLVGQGCQAIGQKLASVLSPLSSNAVFAEYTVGADKQLSVPVWELQARATRERLEAAESLHQNLADTKAQLVERSRALFNAERAAVDAQTAAESASQRVRALVERAQDVAQVRTECEQAQRKAAESAAEVEHLTADFQKLARENKALREKVAAYQSELAAPASAPAVPATPAAAASGAQPLSKQWANTLANVTDALGNKRSSSVNLLQVAPPVESTFDSDMLKRANCVLRQQLALAQTNVSAIDLARSLPPLSLPPRHTRPALAAVAESSLGQPLTSQQAVALPLASSVSGSAKPSQALVSAIESIATRAAAASQKLLLQRAAVRLVDVSESSQAPIRTQLEQQHGAVRLVEKEAHLLRVALSRQAASLNAARDSAARPASNPVSAGTLTAGQYPVARLSLPNGVAGAETRVVMRPAEFHRLHAAMVC